MRTRKLLFPGAAILLIASAAYVMPGMPNAARAQDGNPAAPISNPPVVAQAASAVDAYWTPERMANAVPMEKLVAGSPNPIHGPVPRDVSGGPMAIQGNSPGEAPGGVAVPALDAALGGGPSAPVLTWYTYPFPYTHSFIGGGWPALYPLRTNGKLFFSQNGSDFVCSGTSLTSGTGGNRRIAWTAGHCLHDGSNINLFPHWSTNVLFCPAYSNGSVGPWGCWSWLTEVTPTGWFSSGNFKVDYGLIMTANTSTYGYGRLGDTVGTQGLATSVADPNEFWSMGYPAASPYNGNDLIWTTSSEAVIDDPNAAWTGPLPMGLGSDETGGSSGGAWLWSAKLGSPGFVNSNNDYKYIAQPNAMYGPWYDSNTFSFWDGLRTLYP